ncbi:MAG TPA: acetate--CoA ligase family protein [Candidatus Eisenbacteria bacterium]
MSGTATPDARAPEAAPRESTLAPGPGGGAAPALAPIGAAPDHGAIARLLEAARFRAQGVLLESEGLAVLEALGVRVPRRVECPTPAQAAAAAEETLTGERVVLKALVPGLLHKTEAGAVRILPRRRDAVAAAAADMERTLADRPLVGFLLCEFVAHEAGFGHEFLLGMRWSRDFGPVVTLAAGGLDAAFLSGALDPPGRLAALVPGTARRDVERAIDRLAPARLAVTGQRGRPPALERGVLVDVVERFLALAAASCPRPLAEFEVNPLVVEGGTLVALDAVATFTRGTEALPAARPLGKLRHLLEPDSVAVAGVSERVNPGRIILRNLLAEGFDPERITVVKPGVERIDGCRCVPALAALPHPVDLAVLSVSAPQAAAMLTDLIEQQRAQAVVLIPGGLEESPEGEPLAARMRAAIAAARGRPDQGPVVIGGNCLGVRSVPGRINTLFIPAPKLPAPRGEAAPLALVTGSGAFAVSKISKLAAINPRYTITIGNQMDVTVADVVEHLAGDPAVRVIAIYLEGLKQLDGARLLAAARALDRQGRTVILYRAGRTAAGAAAAASHTAAVAGDYAITRPLAEGAGIEVAESLADFEDLVRLFVRLDGRPVTGLRLGAVSNAGYECVAIADSLGPFELARWAAGTAGALRGTLREARLEDIVRVRNPLDLTPILGDAHYEEIVRRILADPGVDVGLVGCVPLTGALQTLAAGPGHDEDVEREGGIAPRLARLAAEGGKPWVVVVDAGARYDPLVRVLEAGGLPVFRTADRALRLLARFCRHHLDRAPAG